MSPKPIPEDLQLRISKCIAESIGLNFPPARWVDLQRGLASAIDELGFSDLATGAEWLLSTPLTKTELDVIASHLTIGETYFFREKRTFEVLREDILPQLIDLRRNNTRQLRIWSAGCCTGEEPYSLAIVLRELIPDLTNWQITILATDINVNYLKKARAGAYREWAFREAPGWIKDRYFECAADGTYTILPEIKRMVTFAQLNLADNAIPSRGAETRAMDLIFCRNVLMYFSPAQARKVVSGLHRALVNEGWLTVSPSETSQVLFKQFATVNFPGLVLYRKADTAFREETTLPAITLEQPVGVLPEPVPVSSEEGSHEISNEPTVDSKTFALLTRGLADQGRLRDALLWCDRWIQTYKLDPFAHYLRAIVLQELKESEQAQRSLQTSIYLSPKFVLAHFASGNLALAIGKPAIARKHFANALSLLRNYETHEVLPDSDGLTAGRLSEIIISITEAKETLRRSRR